MAGSLTFRAYTSDDGSVYSLRIDESNASATSGGSAAILAPVRTASSPQLPRGVTPRYCNAFLTANPLIRRRFYIGNPVAASAVIATGSLSAEYAPGATGGAGVPAPWSVTSYRGEKYTIPVGFGSPDTGLTDGDTAQ